MKDGDEENEDYQSAVESIIAQLQKQGLGQLIARIASNGISSRAYRC